MKHLLLAAAILISGCNATDPAPELEGTYQHKIIGNDGSAIIQFIFKDDATYQGKSYITLLDGSIDCLMSEGAGKWAISGKTLKLTDKKARNREDCDTSFSAWLDRPSSNEEIRNVTATGFELYISPDEESPAEWIKFAKL